MIFSHYLFVLFASATSVQGEQTDELRRIPAIHDGKVWRTVWLYDAATGQSYPDTPSVQVDNELEAPGRLGESPCLWGWVDCGKVGGKPPHASSTPPWRSSSGNSNPGARIPYGRRRAVPGLLFQSDVSTGRAYPQFAYAPKAHDNGEIPAYDGPMASGGEWTHGEREDHEFRRTPFPRGLPLAYMDSATGRPYTNIPSAHVQQNVNGEIPAYDGRLEAEADLASGNNEFRRRFKYGIPMMMMNPATGRPYPNIPSAQNVDNKLGSSSPAVSSAQQQTTPPIVGLHWLYTWMYVNTATGTRYPEVVGVHKQNGRRRLNVDIKLAPLELVPNELAPRSKEICEHGSGAIEISVEDALDDPNLSESTRKAVQKALENGETKFTSEGAFECVHQASWRLKKAQRIIDGYTPFVVTAAKDEGRLSELKKVGDIYEICHVAAKSGASKEYLLCHTPAHAAIYATSTDSSPEHEFDIVCHDVQPDNPVADLKCHALHNGDTAFLHRLHTE